MSDPLRQLEARPEPARPAPAAPVAARPRTGSAFGQLLLSRLREFVREPEVVFWVFGFPVLLAIGLGIAFRNRTVESVPVAVVEGPRAAELMDALGKAGGVQPRLRTSSAAADELRLGKIDLVVAAREDAGGAPGYEYRFDPTRGDSLHARRLVDDKLQRAAGRVDPVASSDVLVTEPGARYIDFLIPGLLGMNIMSGGMWGVGFVLVEMRTRKMLKRLAATPMRRADFFGAMMTSRMALVFGEMVLLLVFGWLVFGLLIRGSLLAIAFLVLLGASVFSGLGLLVASRARKIETVSGLINLVMLPMFVFSGIFFSSERFPAVLQPFIKALPLTALNDSLRAVILEGASLGSQWARVAVMAAWGLVAFLIALRKFRWT